MGVGVGAGEEEEGGRGRKGKWMNAIKRTSFSWCEAYAFRYDAYASFAD